MYIAIHVKRGLIECLFDKAEKVTLDGKHLNQDKQHLTKFCMPMTIQNILLALMQLEEKGTPRMSRSGFIRPS